MKYHVYSHELEGYLAMDFSTRDEALAWRLNYLKTRATWNHKESLYIIAQPTKE